MTNAYEILEETLREKDNPSYSYPTPWNRTYYRFFEKCAEAGVKIPYKGGINSPQEFLNDLKI